MRVRPRVVVLSLLGLVVVGALLLLYSRELFGVDVIKNFFLQQLETSLRRVILQKPALCHARRRWP